VFAGGVVLGGAEAFGERDEHHADASGGQRAGIVQADVRQPERRQATVDLPHDRDIGLEQLDGGDAERDGDERARDARH